MVLKKARLHKICPLPVRAAEPSRGGWMDPGLPHGRGRSYCSVERGRESATPSTDPHAHPPPAPPAPAGGPRRRQRVWAVWTQLVDRPWALTNKRFFRWWPDGGTIHYAILWLVSLSHTAWSGADCIRAWSLLWSVLWQKGHKCSQHGPGLIILCHQCDFMTRSFCISWWAVRDILAQRAGFKMNPTKVIPHSF